MNDDRNILPLKNGLSRTAQQTDKLILDVEKKAGIVKQRRIKLRRTFTVAAAAFAAAAVGAVAGSAYISYYHEHSVDKYVKNSSSVEIEFDYDAMSSENSHFRVTLDKVLCDGENVMLIITIDSLDGTCVSDARPYISFSRDGQTYHAPWTGGYAYYDTQDELDGKSYSFVHYFPLRGRAGSDTVKELTLNFSQIGYNGDLHDPGENMYEGISFDVMFKKNVNTADLYDSKGNKLILSQFAIYSDEIPILPEDHEGYPGDSFYYIAGDGTKIHHSDLPGTYGDGGTLLILSEIIDIDDYKGIEINGVEYLKR